jgi:hypothetical protein
MAGFVIFQTENFSTPILHRIQVRFIHAFLPEAKKPYNLKAVHQPELDIHGIAFQGGGVQHPNQPQGYRGRADCGH